MAVELRFISVVIRRASLQRLDRKRRWVVRQALRWLPEWYREDDHLLATSFMDPRNVQAFCEGLGALTGLGVGADMAIVDAQTGAGDRPAWLVHDVVAWGQGIASHPGESWELVDPLPEPFPAFLADRVAQAGPDPTPWPPVDPRWGAPSEYAGGSSDSASGAVDLTYRPRWIPAFLRELGQAAGVGET
jgi:hypothetical protein